MKYDVFFRSWCCKNIHLRERIKTNPTNYCVKSVMQGQPRAMPRMPGQGGQSRDEEMAKQAFDNMITFSQRLGEIRTFIPDPVIQNIVAQAGMFTSDPNVARILNIECDKFIWDLMMKLKETMPPAEDNAPRMVRLENVKQVLAQKRMRVDRPDFIVGPIENPVPPAPESLDLTGWLDLDPPEGGEAF